MAWREVASAITVRLAEGGLDLVAACADGARLGLVAGNSRVLWPRFKDWLAADAVRRRLAHPLDACVEEVVGRAVAGVPCTVHHAHDGPPWLPIQRLAERAGLAWLAPSNLAIHPVFGPWISLRAYIVVDEVGPSTPPAPAPACAACPHACVPAFERARRTLDAAGPAASSRASWRDWLAVRDACPVGREHRFQDDQIRYGYTKDRAVLGNG